MLLNQGAIEQILIDYLHSKGRVHVERGRKAQDLELPGRFDQNGDDEFPVHVRVVSANGEGEYLELSFGDVSRNR